jgi:hypothetical protein
MSDSRPRRPRAARLTPLAFALALAGVSSARAARGQDLAAEARQRYADGVAAFERHDYPRAVEDFATVYRATGQTKHLWNLALAEYEAKRPIEALAHLREYVTRRDVNARNEARAHALIAELSSQVAHVSIVAPDGGEVTMDGRPLGVAPLRSPVDVDPTQEHVIVVRRGGDEARRSVRAAGPQDVSIEVTFPVSPPSSPAAPPAKSSASPVVTTTASFARKDPSPRPSVPSSSSSSSARTWVTVGLGVGALALAGGAVYFGAQSSSDSDDAARIRAGLPANACPRAAGCADLDSALSSQDAHHTASLVLFGGAGVLAVAAAASFFFWPRGGEPTSRAGALVPVLGPDVAGAGYVGVF